MVARLLLLVFVFVYASSVYAITPDELRMLVGEAAAQQRLKAQRIRGGDITSLLPKPYEESAVSRSVKHQTKQSELLVSVKPERVQQGRAEKGTPVSSKYSVNTEPHASVQPRSDTQERRGGAGKPTKAVVKPDHLYVPPPRKGGSAPKTVTDAVVHDRKKFGIRIGSWLEGELINDTSNVTPGFKTFRVTSTFVGRYRKLDAGSELFGSASFNDNTQRLEFILTRGVTVDGEEFDFSGQVFDLTKVSGLTGVIKENEILDSAIDSGKLAAGQSVISSIVTGNPLADAAVAAAGTVMTAGENAQDAKSREKYIIFTSSQPVHIYVQKSF